MEDETEEMTEEELVAEEEVGKLLLLLVLQQCCIFQMVIPTVAVEGDKKENTVCPVCREEFDTFYKQVNKSIKCQLLLNLCLLSG